MSLRFLPAALAAVLCACGGSAFVAAADGGDDGAAAPADAGDDSAPDAGNIGGPITCGPGAGAPMCGKTCCVVKANGNYDFRCEDGVVCGASDGTGLHCNDSTDCHADQVCCIAKVSNAFTSFCATSCASGQGQLCTAPLDAKCPATAPCSTNQIDSWNLPTPPYATCGGVQAP
jgi:hypothetical protein